MSTSICSEQIPISNIGSQEAISTITEIAPTTSVPLVVRDFVAVVIRVAVSHLKAQLRQSGGQRVPFIAEALRTLPRPPGGSRIAHFLEPVLVASATDGS